MKLFPNAAHSMTQLAQWLETLEWASRYQLEDKELVCPWDVGIRACSHHPLGEGD